MVDSRTSCPLCTALSDRSSTHSSHGPGPGTLLHCTGLDAPVAITAAAAIGSGFYARVHAGRVRCDDVAVKTYRRLPRSAGGAARVWGRFTAEWHALAALRGAPHVVALRGWAIAPRPCVVTSLHGASLADGVAARHGAQGYAHSDNSRPPALCTFPAGPCDGVAAVAAALRALRAAHAAGVAHGDVRAGNVLLSAAGGADAAVLCDWNSACAARAGVLPPGVACAADALLPPRDGEVPEERDLRDLGRVVWHIATGRVALPAGRAAARFAAAAAALAAADAAVGAAARALWTVPDADADAAVPSAARYDAIAAALDAAAGSPLCRLPLPARREEEEEEEDGDP